MPEKISVVINTLNEEKNIRRVIDSVKWADEIIVCDMYSDDETVKIAKEMGAKVVFYKRVGYVEPARNFAISKASGDWILILDADEEIADKLADRLRKIAKNSLEINYIEIPRKNIIFGKWIKYSGWWPDFQIRFFKKGKVLWNDQIHIKPKTEGEGLKLELEEKWAIIHHNYQTIGQFVERMNRYTQIEEEQLRKSGYQFSWQDLFEKPMSEFLSRFFAREGYKDGLHGLSLSLLQAFSFLVLYLKLWENDGFQSKTLEISEIQDETNKMEDLITHWIDKSKNSTLLGKFVKIFKK